MSLNQAIFNPLQFRLFGTISPTYIAVGSPIPLPIFILRIINDTNGDMFFSLDGVNDQIFIPLSSSVIYNIAANHSLAQPFSIEGKVQFYVRESTTATDGGVYIESVSPNLQAPSLFA